MTGTDPAVEAARRAWDGTDRHTTRVPFDQLPRENKFVQLQITAAREALAPIREVIAQADADLAVEGLTEGRAMTVLFQAVEAIRRLSTTSEELNHD